MRSSHSRISSSDVFRQRRLNVSPSSPLPRKGSGRILDGLCHEFEPAILPSAVRRKDYDALFERPCFVFYAPMGFGVEFGTVRDACEKLSLEDSWLILLNDASAGIHRPEGRWDDENSLWPNYELQQTRPSHHCCNRGVSRAGSLSLYR